jgi:hypothetical protein
VKPSGVGLLDGPEGVGPTKLEGTDVNIFTELFVFAPVREQDDLLFRALLDTGAEYLARTELSIVVLEVVMTPSLRPLCEGATTVFDIERTDWHFFLSFAYERRLLADNTTRRLFREIVSKASVL